MGDGACVRVTCRREDAERFQQLGFVEDEAESDIAVSMVDDEANHAHYSAMTALAKAGVVFCGWHDAGGEYDGSMFASDGTGKYHEVLPTANEALALAHVRPDGIIAEGDLDRVRKVLRGARRRASGARNCGGGIGMTRLTTDSRVLRETCAVVQRKPLVIELRAHTAYLRPKGARWGYEVDHQSILLQGAEKAAEQARIERPNRREERTRRW